jgi:hypothetical protein
VAAICRFLFFLLLVGSHFSHAIYPDSPALQPTMLISHGVDFVFAAPSVIQLSSCSTTDIANELNLLSAHSVQVS